MEQGSSLAKSGTTATTTAGSRTLHPKDPLPRKQCTEHIVQNSRSFHILIHLRLFVIASSRSGSGSIKVKRQRASLLCPTSPKQLAGDPTDPTSDSHEASMPKQRRSVVPCPESNLGAAIPSARSPPPEIMRIERICCMYAYMCLCM